MILDIQSVEVLASGNKQIKFLIMVIQRTVERKNIVLLDVDIFFLTVFVLLTYKADSLFLKTGFLVFPMLSVLFSSKKCAGEVVDRLVL